MDPSRVPWTREYAFIRAVFTIRAADTLKRFYPCCIYHTCRGYKCSGADPELLPAILNQRKAFAMKNILLISTGGTIASKPTAQGLAPALSPDELLAHLPGIGGICKVETLGLFDLDSTNMTPALWVELAGVIEKKYADYDGFVITHGTDTMAYAAAALSYLIRTSPKPIVLTGSQISIYADDTDAVGNLTSAFLYAASEYACGVHIVFDGKVILGTRARKMRTKSFNAFSSIDYPDVAHIRGGRVINFIDERHECAAPKFYHDLCPEVLSIRLIPGMSPSVFDFAAGHARAVIIESFGVGGIPYYDSTDFADAVGRLIKADVRVIITTQVPHEGSDMDVYKVGHAVKAKYKLIEAYDMTTEALILKTMWSLAESRDDESFRACFESPVAHDIL